MPVSSAVLVKQEYRPTYTLTDKSFGRPLHSEAVRPLTPQISQIEFLKVEEEVPARDWGSSSSKSSSCCKNATENICNIPKPLKIFVAAFLGASTALLIAIPLSITAVYYSFPTTTTVQTASTSITSTTSTTVTTVTSTTTTTTTSTTTSTTITTTTTTTTTTSQTSCLAPCICGGIASYTHWQPYSTNGMYMTISTSACNFTQTPQYYTTISASTVHWELSGYDSIYSPSATSFTIYSKNFPGWTASTIVSYANTYAWNVNWVGMY